MLPIVETKITSEKILITDWASQIAELQARIAASQTRITRLNEDNAVADGLLQAAQDAKGKISNQEIIADLLVQLSMLFGGGDNPDDGNGNQRHPEPQPSDDGGCELVSQPLNQAVERADDVPAVGTAETLTDAIAVNSEPLIGQSCEWASPWASPLASPLSSWLCCQIEDAPASALQGQSVDLAQVAFSKDGFKYLDGNEAITKEPAYFELIPVSDSVAYFRNNKTGEIACTYLGGNNKQKLKLWGEWLCHQHSVGSGFQLRDAERLTAFKHEIKIWGMSLAQIQRLAESNTQKNPPSNYGAAPKRKIEPVAPLPKPLQIDDVEPGDIVRSTTVKNWTYVVLAKMENGMLDCQRSNTPEGTPEIRLTVHPASVELVSKAATKVEPTEQPQHVSIDVDDAPTGVRLERTDDAFHTEYRVWAWSIVRIFGKPKVQQKSIGTLTEGTQGISARRPHGMPNPQCFQHTLDAIKYLMQGASLKLADIEVAYNRHQEQVAIAAIPAVTPEQAKADLFGEPATTPLVLADAFGGFSF